MRYTRRSLFGLSLGLGNRGPARRDDGAGSGSTESGSGSTDTNTGSDGQADKDGQDDSTGSKAPNIEGEVDKERVARTIAAAREGESKAKAAAKAANERVAQILKAAGLTPDGKEDPAEQLRAAREAADKAAMAARDSAVELAVYKSAGKAGADPDALLDSTRFRGSVKDLDPSAADFGDKVTAAIKDAVKANPKLAATAAGATKQGADHSGSGGTRTRPKDLASAVAKKLGG